MLNTAGLPLGITMVHRLNSRPAAIRVTAPGRETMYSIESIASSPYSVYEQAVDTRIAWLDIPASEVPALRATLLATYDAFCAHYRLSWTPRIVFDLNAVDPSTSPARKEVRPWTTEDDDYLRARYPLDSCVSLAEALDRGEGAIRMRASRLGVTKS